MGAREKVRRVRQEAQRAGRFVLLHGQIKPAENGIYLSGLDGSLHRPAWARFGKRRVAVSHVVGSNVDINGRDTSLTR